MRNVSDESCRENQSTHFIFNISFLNLAFYEIRWKNIVDSGRPQTTKSCMHIACWMPKTANTLSEYATLVAFPLQ
jgi:hypothetical protein